MKKQLFLTIGLAILGSTVAHADTKLSPEALGAIDGAVTYCLHVVDPNEKPKIRALHRKLLGNMSARDCEAAAKTAPYRTKYKDIQEQIRRQFGSSAGAMCTAFVDAQ
jgi:hypothetical protein